jgi:putative membrane protein
MNMKQSIIARRVVLAGIGSAIVIPTLVRAEPSPAGGDAEAKHASDTLAVGSLSLAASRLALRKARNPDVKEFAQFEVAEQETMANVINEIQSHRATGQMNEVTEAEIQQHLDAAAKSDLQRLEGLHAGAEFDREYVKLQREGHQKLLKIQEAYLADGSDLPSLVTAKLARAQINEHLQLLADIQRDAGTVGRTRERE